MTFSVSLALLMRRGVSMKDQSIMQDVLDQDTLLSVRRLVGFIVTMTFVLELTGAAILFTAMRPIFDHSWEAGWHALFHSVSAFCNAGFSTFSDSLTGFAYNVPVNLTVGSLIVLGGIGFVVIGDFHRALKNWIKNRRGPRHKFRIQSRLALGWTGGLVLLGTGLAYWIEHGRLLDGMSYNNALLVSLFQSSLLLVCGAIGLMAVFEPDKDFMDLSFETVSAFATVGLSTGITSSLSVPGRILITVLMFVGRLGPLTIGFAFMLRQKRPAKYSYAEERIMIG